MKTQLSIELLFRLVKKSGLKVLIFNRTVDPVMNPAVLSENIFVEINNLVELSIAEGRRQECERTKSILENFGALDDKDYSKVVHVAKAVYADIVSENIESELSQLAINITHQPKRKS